MARFEVFENPNRGTRKLVPFLLDVQSDLLDPLSTRVVVPLIAASEFGKPASRLNPQFEIGGIAVVMSTAELAGVSMAAIGSKVLSLEECRDEITAALDILFTGF